MEIRLVLTIVVMFALLLAIVAGLLAARFMMHAAETGSARVDEVHDR